jgi:threonine/homoserine/homoserine lactone efflux protein
MLAAIVFALTLFAINVLTPGASFVLTVSNAMSHGRRTGYGIALGLATADTLFALAAVLGLATVVSSHPTLLKGIAFFGGLWFVYGGVRLVLRGKAQSLPQEADGVQGELPLSLAYRLGLTAGSFNPQAVIFFSTMFVAALSTRPNALTLAILVLGVAAVSSVTRCTIVRLLTQDKVKSVFSKHRRKVETCSGTAMAAFGLKLAAPVAIFAATSI